MFDDIAPFTLTLFRWLLAIALLLPFTWRHVKGDWVAITAAWGILTVLAILSVSIYATAMYIVAQTTEAINISLVGSITPAVVVLFSWLMIGERIDRQQGIGFVVALIGVVAVIARGELENLDRSAVPYRRSHHPGGRGVVGRSTRFYSSVIRWTCTR